MDLPPKLTSELVKMRRNPANFSVLKQLKCSFCSDPKSAYQLLNAKFDTPVGSWCPIHGWLFFDSVRIPPTERLTASELAELQLQQRRKRGPRLSHERIRP